MNLKEHLNNPKELEKLFREDKSNFRKEFNLIYPEIREQTVAQLWYERLNYEQEPLSWGNSIELPLILLMSIIAGFIARIPTFFDLDQDLFFQRNIGFVFLPLLTVYFAWKHNVTLKKSLVIIATLLISAIYINFLPNDITSDTIVLACIHLPLFLWSVGGLAFADGLYKNVQKRLEFLRYNGDVVVMTTIILISGGILTAITIGLFELIGLNIIEFYMRNVGVLGLSSAPIIATFLVRNNPQLVQHISPVVAKLFTPLVFVMLCIYLIAVISTGKDPYNDRDFLLIFNVLLVGVMALILFSVAENAKSESPKWGTLLLFALSIVTIIVNGIALSAIIFRISEWGFTPNRLAVLGGNVLILLNLFIVTYKLFQTLENKSELEKVEQSIAQFLPIYGFWAAFVTFVFPLLFSFK